jgi:hypothetical protein
MATQRELLDAYNSLSSRLVRGLGVRVAGAFTNLGSWRDADFERFTKMIEPTLTGGRLQAARLQVGFYQQMARARGEVFNAPSISPSDFTVPKLRNGAAAQEVYRRPFKDVYFALSQKKGMTEAIFEGANRISSIVSTDMQLARRNAGFLSRRANDNIVGYARTLTGSENCALCYVASTQRYTRDKLLPIHPGCDCGEMPIYGDQDPGQVINDIRLDATHEAVESRFGLQDRGARDIGLGKTYTRKDGSIVKADYTAIAIREHGELGPVLTVAGQHFRGPGSI